MKTLKIILIGILSVLIIFLTAGLCIFLGGGISNSEQYWRGTYTLQKTREIDMTDVSKLTMSFEGTGYDITLVPADGEQIVLKEYFTYEAEEEKFASLKKENGGLQIKGVPNNNFSSLLSFENGKLRFGINRAGYVILCVPMQLFAQLETAEIISSSGNIVFDFSVEELSKVMNLKELRLNVSSGDITAPFLRAENAIIDSSSGNVKLGDCEGSFLVGTTSGDVKIESHKGDLSANSSSGNQRINSCEGNLQVNTSSGDIKVGNQKGDLDTNSNSGNQTVESCVGNLKAYASSGNIRVTELAGKAEVQTASGNITVNVTELLGDISLTGSSGNGTLTLPQDSSFTFRAKTGSGDIATYFDDELSYNKKGNQAEGTVGSSPSCVIRCSFASGNVRVKE